MPTVIVDELDSIEATFYQLLGYTLFMEMHSASDNQAIFCLIAPAAYSNSAI